MLQAEGKLSLVVKKKSDGILFSGKPLFCSGGKSVVLFRGHTCHLYNTSTGNYIKELFKCQSKIITLQLHPNDNNLLVTVTEDGEISVYNLESNKLVHETKLILSSNVLNTKLIYKFDGASSGEKFDWNTQNLSSVNERKFLYAFIKVYHQNPSKLLVWASWCLKDEVKSHVSVFSYEDGHQKLSFAFRKTELKKRYLNFALSKSQPQDVFVGISENSVHVINFENPKTYQYTARKHYVGHDVEINCVDFHPVEYCFATGDSLGRIIIWRNIFDKYPLKEIFHWHALGVKDIVFSTYGNHIFSGGEENVLLKWSVSTRKKQFLPRLSSTICYLSEVSDSSLLLVSTLDSRILVVDFNFESISTIQHFSKWYSIQNNSSFKIFTFDPRSESMVLNGRTGHIQFLSIKDEGKLMYTFDVTNRNYVTSHDYTITNTEVTHALFNSTGEWLITAEARKEELCKKSCLKFWKFLDEKGSFSLNTNIENPHNGLEILSVEISSEDMVATIGYDKKFNLWTLDEHFVGNTVKDIWSIYCSKEYRNLICSAVDFSKDSSLVAVCYGQILTIWDTDSSCLLCTLSPPHKTDALRACKFGNNEFSHLIVTATEDKVFSWNTITLTMLWMVPVKFSFLISDPFSVYMAAFTLENTLIVFNPGSPSPDFVVKNVSDSPVSVGCFVPTCRNICLYFLTEDQVLFCLERNQKLESTLEGIEENKQITPFSALIAENFNQMNSDHKKQVHISQSNWSLLSSLLNSPAHTVSNPSLICSKILKSHLFFTTDEACDQGLKKNNLEKIKARPNQTRTLESKDLDSNSYLLNFVHEIFDSQSFLFKSF